ncbi:DUF6338 family protein [Streptomyces sp. T-3]|nr:DUF6338 family protein [Streptomyces sp. T-3]
MRHTLSSRQPDLHRISKALRSRPGAESGVVNSDRAAARGELARHSVAVLPSTIQQLTVLVVLVLPGVAYLLVRERLRGRFSYSAEPDGRFLRAIGVGILLDCLYAVAAGPWLIDLASDDPRTPIELAALAHRPREVGLAGLLFIVVIPVLAATVEARLLDARNRASLGAAPTGWDALFRSRGDCYIRIRLKSGIWVAGRYGKSSAASSFPAPPDIYLQVQHDIDPEQHIIGLPIPHSGGVYVPGTEIELMEIINGVPRSAGHGTGTRSGPTPVTGAGGNGDPVGGRA